MRTGPACHANGIPPTPGHHPDTRQPRTRTDRQVTQPSSFSSSEMSISSTTYPRARKDAAVVGALAAMTRLSLIHISEPTRPY